MRCRGTPGCLAASPRHPPPPRVLPLPARVHACGGAALYVHAFAMRPAASFCNIALALPLCSLRCRRRAKVPVEAAAQAEAMGWARARSSLRGRVRTLAPAPSISRSTTRLPRPTRSLAGTRGGRKRGRSCAPQAEPARDPHWHYNLQNAIKNQNSDQRAQKAFGAPRSLSPPTPPRAARAAKRGGLGAASAADPRAPAAASQRAVIAAGRLAAEVGTASRRCRGAVAPAVVSVTAVGPPVAVAAGGAAALHPCSTHGPSRVGGGRAPAAALGHTDTPQGLAHAAPGCVLSATAERQESGGAAGGPGLPACARARARGLLPRPRRPAAARPSRGTAAAAAAMAQQDMFYLRYYVGEWRRRRWRRRATAPCVRAQRRPLHTHARPAFDGPSRTHAATRREMPPFYAHAHRAPPLHHAVPLQSSRASSAAHARRPAPYPARAAPAAAAAAARASLAG
jgi:hypothetical protein